ncbi:hypothetical protein [Candidatus Epulonipiscium viviparus]|uniref:hypothetical protein n=1 Tax=Candidatus Epulonipiscium viviparus TaxID=420336 RepID=UPI00016C09D3|nr:hypothetical protein [Candidatus Epulopiscium viviparus]
MTNTTKQVNQLKNCVSDVSLVQNFLNMLETDAGKEWEGKSATAWKNALSKQKEAVISLIDEMEQVITTIERVTDKIRAEEIREMEKRHEKEDR